MSRARICWFLAAGLAAASVPSLASPAIAQDVRSFDGHGNRVQSVAFSPDGKQITSGSYDTSARVWEVSSGKMLRSLPHINWVMHVAYSPDGKTLATGCYDRQIRLYDANTGGMLRSYPLHTSAVNMFAFAPDGKTMASVAMELNLRIWDTTSLREHRAVVADPTSNIFAVAFSPDGKTVATGGQDRNIRLWEASTGKELARFTGHNDVVVSLAFTPDGRTLLSGSHDRTVRLWEVSTGKERMQFTGHTNLVRSVAISADGRTAASAGYDYVIRLWDTLSGKELKKLEGHRNIVWSVAFSPDSKLLASGSEDRSIRVWKVQDVTERKAPKVEEPTAVELAALWNTLGSEDAGKAYKAVADLAQVPPSALAQFKEKLKPVRELDGEAEKRVGKLITDLADEEFATRKRAMDSLTTLGTPVAPALRRALSTCADVDVRLRLHVVLRTMDVTGMTPEQMRTLRALEVLERINSKEAQELLEGLAKGVSDAFLTIQAKHSLARVNRRLAKK